MTQINNTLSGINTMGMSYPYSSSQKNEQTAASSQQTETKSQQTNSSTSSVNTTSPASSTALKTAAATGQATLSPAYSVEISQEGARLSSLNASSSSSDTAATNNVSGSAATLNQPAASATTTRSAASDDSSASGTTNLSQYSESELKQLLNSGKITQGEYTAEMSKRTQETQETKAATNTAIDFA